MTYNANIVAEDLTKIFCHNDTKTTAFQDLNFTVTSGEFLCILGPSGCGKSSVLNTICGLETPTSGKLTVADTHINKNKKAKISMVFQEHGLFPWMTLKDNISFPLKNDCHFDKLDIDYISTQFLLKVGLLKFAAFYPHQVSGGMRQRISIARSFAVDPDILLMDEPFVFLDYQNRLLLQDMLLKLWQGSNKTVLFVTHNINEAVSLSDSVMIMTAHPGKIKAKIKIDLTRPRDMFEIRKSAHFTNYVNDITDLIKDEMITTQQQAQIGSGHL